MDSWFSDQGDKDFLFESNDMLQGVFLASYEGISVKTKYGLKQDFFYQLSQEGLIPLQAQKTEDFQLEEGQNLIQKK